MSKSLMIVVIGSSWPVLLQGNRLGSGGGHAIIGVHLKVPGLRREALSHVYVLKLLALLGLGGKPLLITQIILPGRHHAGHRPVTTGTQIILFGQKSCWAVGKSLLGPRSFAWAETFWAACHYWDPDYLP